MKTHQVLVGFAAESNDVLEKAEKKLKNKNLDFIVANDITSSDTGFGSEDNKVVILSKNNEKLELEKMSKKEVASNIFDMIWEKREGRFSLYTIILYKSKYPINSYEFKFNC